MAVQTGTKYRFTAKIAFDYQCSQCGTKNTGTGTLEKEVFTSALIRVNPREEANSYFREKINSLNSDPVPDRYSDTALSCRCKTCGKFEPWSASLPKWPTPHLLWLLFPTLLIAVTGIIPPGALRFLCLASGSIPYLALVIRCMVKRSKRLKAIGALPAESLPKVYSVI